MSKEIVYDVRVEFGDCDPARIVWFPNFFRWIDHASRHFFVGCGVPPWHETEKTLGVIGTPVVDTKARFFKTATYGDALQFHISIPEWRGKSFVMRYKVMRGADPIMECDEIRLFVGRHDTDPNGIKALPIPDEIRKLCE